MHAAVTKGATQPMLRLKRREHGLRCGKLPINVILVFKWLVEERHRQPGARVRMEACASPDLVFDNYAGEEAANQDESHKVGVQHAT